MMEGWSVMKIMADLFILKIFRQKIEKMLKFVYAKYY